MSIIWIALYVNANVNVTFFDSFGVEHFSKEIKNSSGIKLFRQIFIEYKHMSIMCGHLCIGFINFIKK